MALDESRKNDVVFTDRGIKYLIDKDLYDEVKPINVDYIQSFRGSGFKLTSNLDAGNPWGSSCCG